MVQNTKGTKTVEELSSNSFPPSQFLHSILTNQYYQFLVKPWIFMPYMYIYVYVYNMFLLNMYIYVYVCVYNVCILYIYII